MRPLQPTKRGNECLELLQEHNRRKDLKPTECASLQLRPVDHFLGNLKQAVYAGSWEASNIDQLKKRDHLEVKDIGVLAITKRILGPNDQGQTCRQQWPFDCFVNFPFSPDNTVCKISFFFHLLHIFIEIYPFESCLIFTTQAFLIVNDISAHDLAPSQKFAEAQRNEQN